MGAPAFTEARDTGATSTYAHAKQNGFRSLGESTIGESRELRQDYRRYLRKPPWTPPLPIHLNIYLYFYYFRILVKYFIH